MTKAIDAKVKCKDCGVEEHILTQHITSKHDGVVAYLDKYPGAPLWSTYGYAAIRRHALSSGVASTPRPRRKVQVRKLFPDFGKRTKTEPRGSVLVFDTPGELTPDLNEHYVFPEDQTLDLIAILEKCARNRPYIKGWSGTGKTDLVVNLAALFNAELLIWNADSFQQRSSLVGHWTVKEGETVWQDGILPLAMKNGYWLLCNELDTIDPHALNIIKPVLEDPPYLLITETGETVSKRTGNLHPDFRIIATANTWARGDNTGLFINTMTQSDADARRWSARLLLDYMPSDVEESVLFRYFNKGTDDDLEKDEPEKFVRVANKIREGFKNGKIDKTFSTGELITWVENFLVLGKGVHYAARLSFLNALPPDVSVTIEEMITAVFGAETGSVTTKADDEEE